MYTITIDLIIIGRLSQVPAKVTAKNKKCQKCFIYIRDDNPLMLQLTCHNFFLLLLFFDLSQLIFVHNSRHEKTFL